jgi:tetratricopeptide (TPR) repeat protein
LGLITLAVFWPAARHGFTGYDDPAYVTGNAHVQGGLKWENVLWAFTTGHASNWHPLTWLSHMLDWQLFGPRAGAQHLVSIGFHIANTLLLFLLLERMTGARWRSALVAALFAWHPLHVESVVWLAERKDVLSGFFFMLTLGAYARYVECGMGNPESRIQKAEGRMENAEASDTQHATRITDHGSRITHHASRYYLLSLFFFACGLMSKPMLVTVPFVLLLLDYWPLRRLSFPILQHSNTPSLPRSAAPPLRLMLEKLPFFTLAAVSSVITFIVQSKGGAVSTSLPIGARLANALMSYVRYLGKLFWPGKLSVFYPHPGHWPAWQIIAAAVLLLAISAAVLRLARRWPYLAVGWLWYCGTLVPVIGLVQVGIQSMADRYTYLPLIGLFIMVVWGAAEWACPARNPNLNLNPNLRPPSPSAGFRRLGFRLGLRLGLAAGVIVAAVCLCLGLTRRQIGYWKDTETLWRHALAVTEMNAIAQHNLGVALAVKGDFDEAIQHYAEAVRLRPQAESAYLSLADALVKTRRFAEAIQQYEEALRLNPGDAGAHNNLGNLLTRVNRGEEAIQHYTEALRLDAGYAEAHYNLGLALAGRGSCRQAAAHFQEVLRLKPGDASARQKLDQALAAQDRCEKALAQYREMLRSRPGDALAHSDLGRALVQAGQWEEGIEQCAEAARLDPKSAEIQYQLGLALVRKGDLEKATGQFGLALKLDPNFAAAHYALGRIAVLQRRVAEALEHWREAARLNPRWADPLLNLAWVLATDPHAELRNGPEAVKLASRAAELAGNRNVKILDTLAAAYAEAGQYSEASSTAREAQTAAAAQGQPDLAEQIQQRLALYDSRQPYREAEADHL